MKQLVFIISFIVAVSAFNADSQLWEEFKKNHSKTFQSLADEKYRLELFRSNLRKIEKHNAQYAQGLTNYFLKVTQFADMTDEEFEDKYLCFRTPRVNHTSKFTLSENETVPESIDWRERGAVLEVKDQGNCGACYAFSTKQIEATAAENSGPPKVLFLGGNFEVLDHNRILARNKRLFTATGALEGQNAIKHNKRISLSEQELVDCSAGYLNAGCKGGSIMFSFRYVQDFGGISTEESYPYNAKQGACVRGKNAGIEVLGYKDTFYDENDLKAAVGTVGPVSVAINSRGIKLYGGGIFDDTSCSADINHGVLVVGYGTTNNSEYWIIKNSWGTKWGEQGYLRISRNKKLCGLGILSTYPIIA